MILPFLEDTMEASGNHDGRTCEDTIIDSDDSSLYLAIHRLRSAMRNLIVYVKQRPYLQMFLERVAEMFEIVVFTASQNIYAKQLLDILDPDKKLVSHRAYCESCIFSDGCYTKDLTVLGVDLTKIATIDNSP
ncbi:CTD small phosphatase-like protein 2 [Camellia lanceoleosa]|uniref:CTD small phosphatase-like protein 2 n=1 Tax=Camellia lanceoleosa TaxID=1840588 RepID=A0ACC0FB31_9ERIC|nr:CTD small phosphatase-like protein 2 [Camellia lanceoleosa]